MDKTLYDEIYDFSNLIESFKEARKEKIKTSDVIKYSLNTTVNLLSLHKRLRDRDWFPHKCRQFIIYEPKKRIIQAPTFEDRIVHHALVRKVRHLFENKFIEHSYACREGKGIHSAVDNLQILMRKIQSQSSEPYVIQADISKYFPSINHNLLIKFISKEISCIRTIALWWSLIRYYTPNSDHGIPLGALTSQLSANIYLNELDQKITKIYKIPFYIRYMDDFIILTENKKEAQQLLKIIYKEVDLLKLSINPKTHIYPMRLGINFCGYRTWTTHRLPRKRITKRIRRLFKKLKTPYETGLITKEDVRRRLDSYFGYLTKCSSLTTVIYLYNDFPYLNSIRPLTDIYKRDLLHSIGRNYLDCDFISDLLFADE